MTADAALAQTPAYSCSDAFATFGSQVEPGWIRQALDTAHKATLRLRRLPLEAVVWLVIALALFRDRSMEELATELQLARPSRSGKAVAKSALIAARKRLGEMPMAHLFHLSAAAWAARDAQAPRFHGLALYGLDGTTLRVPDTEENRRYLGAPSGGGKRGPASYPVLRLVALMALRQRLVTQAHFGPYTQSESSYAAQLWPAIPEDSLTVVDRNFLNAATLLGLLRGGRNRHFLLRAKKNTKWTRLKRLGPQDQIVRMKVSRAARNKDPSLPPTFEVRVIRYHVKGFRPQWVLTSLLDCEQYPAAEVSSLYHERWELELGYDELKTDLLDRREARLRSKSPPMLRQEMWGVLLAYNLVRQQMEQVAQRLEVPPTRISFVTMLHLMRDEWIVAAVLGQQAPMWELLKLRATGTLVLLPPRRPHRRYPRAVKLKMSNYPRKRPRSGRRHRSPSLK